MRRVCPCCGGDGWLPDAAADEAAILARAEVMVAACTAAGHIVSWDGLIRDAAVAMLLEIEVSTLANWTSASKGPPFALKRAGRRLYDPVAVARFEAGRRK